MGDGLEIHDLHVSIDGKKILNGLNLTVRKGSVEVIMGPNGSGKSTLAHVVMGHPKYKIESGKIMMNGRDVTELSPDKRAKLGLFLGFQYPTDVPGVTVANFLKTSLKALGKDIPAGEYLATLKKKMADLKIDESFSKRYLNEGFSGGEKKRTEILQLAIIKPEVAVLDEIDSGLDVDALRIVASGIESMRGPQTGFLVITHYKRILDYLKPDRIHIMVAGKIVRSGGPELADEIEAQGYEKDRA